MSSLEAFVGFEYGLIMNCNDILNMDLL